LSTTAKTEARKKGKKEDEGDKMEIIKEDGKDAAEVADAKAAESKGADKAGDGKEETAKKEGEEAEGEKKDSDKKKEPSSTTLANPAR